VQLGLGGTDGEVLDVAANGVAVGSTGNRAAVWMPNGTNSWAAPALLGATASELHGVNTAGNLAVGTDGAHAAYWTYSGTAWSGPNVLPGGCTSAAAVDDGGRIVVNDCPKGSRRVPGVIAPPYAAGNVTFARRSWRQREHDDRGGHFERWCPSSLANPPCAISRSACIGGSRRALTSNRCRLPRHARGSRASGTRRDSAIQCIRGVIDVICPRDDTNLAHTSECSRDGHRLHGVAGRGTGAGRTDRHDAPHGSDWSALAALHGARRTNPDSRQRGGRRSRSDVLRIVHTRSRGHGPGPAAHVRLERRSQGRTRGSST
jgi:hypothetical protein